MQPPDGQRPRPERATRSGNDRLHALLVDDNVAILDILGECLTLLNYRTTTVLNAFAALKVLKKDKVDVVISDYSMPEMDGVEFLKEIRKLFPLEPPPFVLISGTLFSPETICFVEESGAVFLRKPFRLADLTAALEHAAGASASKDVSGEHTEARPDLPSNGDSDMEIGV